MVQDRVANSLQSNMPKFYCDYCSTYLTCDSPSVKKTYCSGRKHKENVKDYYQKWMGEQAQSLIDKWMHFNKEKVTSYSILCSSSWRSNDPTSPKSPGSSLPWYDASTPYGGPPMRQIMGPLPGVMPMGPSPGMRPHMGGHMPMMPGPPMTRPLTCPMIVPTWPGITQLDR
ncbi:PREDICTED: U1 small nuclear ribonucleoprotein C-like [Galeopterus variegatus]|uniref:U1 small nuclear ribonucleoprotein C n=1 Tax=Galeopterus variegatus TaxID=482537 RepID=A0ABM0Q411_GALVR|nr:PREDICTED: U1 small nuclear ribonucleoprotein C-like [Galeopterus variegatus]